MTPKPPKCPRLKRPPKRNILTIGIGILCSTKQKPHSPRPDAFVMIADTMGSTDTDSTDELHKMYIMPESRLFGVCAERMEMVSDLVPSLECEVKALSKRTHGEVMGALNKAVYAHRAQ